MNPMRMVKPRNRRQVYCSKQMDILFVYSCLRFYGGDKMLSRLNNHKLKLKWSKISEVYLGFMFTSVLNAAETPTPSPRLWAHMRGCYWSAKIDDISL
jgi:hypothetical protein